MKSGSFLRRCVPLAGSSWIFVMCLSGLVIQAQAGQFGNFLYRSADSAITITGYVGEASGNVAIPGIIDGLAVRSIGTNAFCFDYSLTGISMPDSVTNIGDYAFMATGLTNIVLPANLVKIGACAFGCDLTSVMIPASVTDIEPYAFQNCSILTNISVAALNSVYSSTNGMLCDKSQTTLIQYPPGIWDDAFVVPDSIACIGDGSLGGSMAKVWIPASVTNIANYAFNYARNLTNIAVASLNPVYSSVDGVVFDKNNIRLIRYPPGRVGAYTIPDNVLSIEQAAFSECTWLSEAIISGSVTNIGDFAFFDCCSLTNIVLGTNVTSIGDYAFDSCSSLIRVAISARVANIGFIAFGSCTSLTNITVDGFNPAFSSVDGIVFDKTQTKLILFPAGKECGSYSIAANVTSIGQWAFENLTNLMIPASVTNIEECAFAACFGLTNISIASFNPAFCSVDGVVYDKNQTTLVVYPPGRSGSYCIPTNVTRISGGAFYENASLCSITIPGGVTNIGDDAFDYCYNLASVFFEGNAPANLGHDVFFDDNSTVYYKNGSTGWASTFADRPTAPWPSITAQRQADQLVLEWPQGVLLETTNLDSGLWITNSAQSPCTVTNDGPQKFYRLKLD